MDRPRPQYLNQLSALDIHFGCFSLSNSSNHNLLTSLTTPKFNDYIIATQPLINHVKLALSIPKPILMAPNLQRGPPTSQDLRLHL